MWAGILAGDCSAFGADHLWYIFAYIEIIIAMPVLKVICVNDIKQDRIRRYCMCVSGVYIILENIFYFVNGVFGTEFVTYNFSLVNRNVLYVLIGYECYRLLQKDSIVWRITKGVSVRRSKGGCFAVYVLCNAGICIEELICLICFSEKQDMLYYSRYSALHIISSTALFCFFMFLPLENEKVNTIIRFIGDKTFYIYLIHYIFVKYIAYNADTGLLEKIPPFIKYSLAVFSVFGISLICAIAIKIVNAILHYIVSYLKSILG